MSRKVFTAGEVLAAADVNNFLMDQSVMSFAGTAARGSAIGTAVEGMVTYLEDSNSLSVNNGTDWTIDRTIQVFPGTAARGSAIPSPVEGMYAHLNDTDTLQFYNGSAWANAGASGALELISSQTVGSAVTSVTFNDVFSASYSEYKIIHNINSSSANNSLLMRMRVAGADNTTSDYRWGEYNIGSFVSKAAQSTNNSTTAYWALSSFAQTFGGSGCTEISSPFEAQYTKFTHFGNGYFLAISAGGFIQTTSFTGFTMYADTGNITGGTISVYGYKKA
jgi:hypothetical protein